jgi:hypothetical protein
VLATGKAGAYQSETLKGLNSNIWVPDLPSNIRLGWKCLALADTLVYYDTPKIISINGSTGPWTGSAGSAISNGKEPKSCLGQVFNYKLGCFALQKHE